MHVELVLYLWAPYSDLVFVHRRRLRQRIAFLVKSVHSDKGKNLLVPETELSPIGQTVEAVSAGFLSKPVTRTIKVSELTTETDRRVPEHLERLAFSTVRISLRGLQQKSQDAETEKERREFQDRQMHFKLTVSSEKVSSFGDWTPTATASLWPSGDGSLGVRAL